MELRAPRSDVGEPAQALTPQEAAFARAASGWVGQLARTLKTCRLYEAANPTVLRFREELAGTLAALVAEHGSLALRFSSTEVSWGDVPLHRARTRDDNLGLPFYRDGVRTLTFSAGIEPREVNAIVDALLRVTSPAADDCDLVTLLWDAELEHVSLEYVSTEADAESESGESGEAAGGTPLMPWPKPSGGETPEPGPIEAAAGAVAPAGAPPSRSDDWTSAELAGEAEAVLADLEARAPAELERFRGEHEAEARDGPIAPMLVLLRDCMESAATAADREDLAHLLPRLLQETITLAAWGDARRTCYLLQSCAAVEETILPSLLDELAQPSSVVTASAVRELDQQGSQVLQEFLAFARQLGPAASGWLMRILGESQQERLRRSLVSLLAELCSDCPERLGPGLSDPRWFVVRNTVQILGAIGGETAVGLLEAVAQHPESRVRQEVVAALGAIELPSARAALHGMLDHADTRTFCAALHQLGASRDAAVAQRLLGWLTAVDFRERPPEERWAVYSSLGTSGDDDVLPRLEEELHRPGWFLGAYEEHRHAVARCIARIGTPRAREILEHGARARSGQVREAAAAALERMTSDG